MSLAGLDRRKGFLPTSSAPFRWMKVNSFPADVAQVIISRRLLRLYLSCLLLTGCEAFEPEPYNLQRHISTITIKVDPMLGMLPNTEGESREGEATVVGDKCTVVLREYPVCLAHEIRHCFEGNWHPKASATFPGNSDDCWTEGQQQNLR